MHQPHRQVHRIFYAVTFPRSVEEQIVDLIDQLRNEDDGAVRWTLAENLHMTLRFLGEVPTDIFKDARRMVSETPLPFPSTLRFGGINAFPSLRRPSVIVLDLEGKEEEDRKNLAALQSTTEKFARDLGLAPERREFHPHLTIGRVRRDRRISPGLRTALESIPVELPEVGVNHLILMESILSREGATYRVVEKTLLSL